MKDGVTYEVVYSFGWYLKKFIQDVREKGGTPILLSLTPRNEWPDGKIERRNDSYGKWYREVAAETGCEFVDVHNITADYLDKVAGSKEAAMSYYNHDHTHTSLKGAQLNAMSVAKGLRLNHSPLAAYLKNPEEKDMGGYLMVYHKDADHGLHMAVSYDGYTFTALNDDKPVIAGDTIAEQKGIRDPHIFRGKDGAFYLAMTDLHVFGKRDGFRETEWERSGEKYGWGNNRGLVLMKSYDLVNWTRTNLDFTRLGGQWTEVGCVWAPEIVYDEEKELLMMHFTTRFGTGKNAIYYVYMNDDFNTMLTEPKVLFEQSYPVIDSDIIKAQGKYHMFMVSHEHTATVRHAVSDRIDGGYVMDNNYNDGERVGHEAPNCWKRIGEDKWIVMYDVYRANPHNFGFTETEDFVSYQPQGRFDGDTFHRTNFSEQKHGAVIWLTKKEVDRLLGK